MDRSAIEAIRENNAFNIRHVDNTDIKAAVIPHNAKLESLEHLMSTPYQFRATFVTHIVSEFTDYSTKNIDNDSAIYIDTHNMEASAIFDHGTIITPEWATHTASIALTKKPAFDELLEKNNVFCNQQDLIDFLSDWEQHIILFDGNNEPILFQKAINRIRKLTLNKNSSAEFEQGDFNHKASAMESVEIKSGDNEIPAYFEMLVQPYQGFSE